MQKSYAYKLIRAAKESAQCPIGHKPANVHQALKRRQSSKRAKQPKIEPSKVYLAAELKPLEKTVNRLENALCREEYREAFVHRDCCKQLDHIVSQIENIIIALGGEDEDQREERA
jgi:ribosome assembly protein YihI (activator of Der GTPase)